MLGFAQEHIHVFSSREVCCAATKPLFEWLFSTVCGGKKIQCFSPDSVLHQLRLFWRAVGPWWYQICALVSRVWNIQVFLGAGYCREVFTCRWLISNICPVCPLCPTGRRSLYVSWDILSQSNLWPMWLFRFPSAKVVVSHSCRECKPEVSHSDRTTRNIWSPWRVFFANFCCLYAVSREGYKQKITTHLGRDIT